MNTNHKAYLYKSTGIERLLLFLTVAAMPLQANLPKFSGFGSAFVLFGLVALYQMATRPGIVMRTARQSVFLAGYCFIAVIAAIELLHGDAAIYGILRILFMLVGGIVVASLCRDRRSFYAGLYGYMLGAIMLSLLLLLESYGNVRALNVSGDFYSISRERADIFSQSSLEENLNSISFYASQGAIIGLVLSLIGSSGITTRRVVLAAVGLFCMTASFVTMSRTGMAIFLVAAAAIGISYGVTRTRIIVSIILLLLAVMIAVPSAVFSRFTLSTQQSTSGYEDSRVHIYSTLAKYLPDHFVTGVGMGKFYGDWGHGTEFENEWGNVGGTHNFFTQALMCWGIGGVLALLLLFWKAYRSFPRKGGRDPLRLCLMGIAISAGLFTMFTHEFELKQFSVALGLLAAANMYVWHARRTAVIPPAWASHRRFIAGRRAGIAHPSHRPPNPVI